MGKLSKKELKQFNEEINQKIKESKYREKVGSKFYDKAHKELDKAKVRKLKLIPQENESVIADIKNKMINVLVEEEKSKLSILTPVVKKVSISSEDDSDLPPNTKPKYPFPHVNERKMIKFMKKMEDDSCSTDRSKELKNCIRKIHYSSQPIWNSPKCLLKAINHSILTKKWHNLTQLLYILIHFTKLAYYRPIIFQYCDNILNKYHPLIEDSGVKDQFQAILKGTRKSKLK